MIQSSSAATALIVFVVLHAVMATGFRTDQEIDQKSRRIGESSVSELDSHSEQMDGIDLQTAYAAMTQSQPRQPMPSVHRGDTEHVQRLEQHPQNRRKRKKPMSELDTHLIQLWQKTTADAHQALNVPPRRHRLSAMQEIKAQEKFREVIENRLQNRAARGVVLKKHVDTLSQADNYKPTLVGEVAPNHEFPQTEGYRPRDGYFEQSPKCDKIMRIWMEKCAFSDYPDSYYWKTPAKMFPPGKPDSAIGKKEKAKTGAKVGLFHTATYIGNMLKATVPQIFDKPLK